MKSHYTCTNMAVTTLQWQAKWDIILILRQRVGFGKYHVVFGNHHIGKSLISIQSIAAIRNDPFDLPYPCTYLLHIYISSARLKISVGDGSLLSLKQFEGP